MSDIATIWNPGAAEGDWSLASIIGGEVDDNLGVTITDEGGNIIKDGRLTFPSPAGLVSGQDLATAVLISLFTDAVASADDLGNSDADPRGWWGGPIGSQLWLRMRSKRTPTLLTAVKDDITAALAWLIADGVASSVEVTVTWRSPGQIGAQIVVTRGGGAVTLSFAWAWEGV